MLCLIVSEQIHVVQCNSEDDRYVRNVPASQPSRSLLHTHSLINLEHFVQLGRPYQHLQIPTSVALELTGACSSHHFQMVVCEEEDLKSSFHFYSPVFHLSKQKGMHFSTEHTLLKENIEWYLTKLVFHLLLNCSPLNSQQNILLLHQKGIMSRSCEVPV